MNAPTLLTALLEKRFKMNPPRTGSDPWGVGIVTIVCISFVPTELSDGSWTHELSDYKCIFKMGAVGPLFPGTLANLGDEVMKL